MSQQAYAKALMFGVASVTSQFTPYSQSFAVTQVNFRPIGTYQTSPENAELVSFSRQ